MNKILKNQKLLILSLVIFSFVFFFFGEMVEAKVESSNGQSAQVQNQTQNQQLLKSTLSPAGNQVQNQNQVKTENQGEEDQIQVRTEEQEGLGEEGEKETTDNTPKRSQNAYEHMSLVAQKVEELLDFENIEGNLGQQVRQIAQTQNQAQEQIRETVQKLDQRKAFWKFLFGADKNALKKLEQQREQNQLRIQQLEQLENQLANQGADLMIRETIETLVQQNTALQEMIETEGKVNGIFGWLLNLFNK